MKSILPGLVAVANWISVAALALMTMTTVMDVAGHYLFNHPLPGSRELSELLMVFLVFGAFAVTELHSGHIDVDVVVARMPPRARALSESFAALLSSGFWGAITWRAAAHAQNVGSAGETMPNLWLPIAPFVWFAAVGCALFTLALIVRLLDALRRLVRP